MPIRKTICYVGVEEGGRRVGESHPKAKVSDWLVFVMRCLHEDHDLTTREIAAVLDVPHPTVSKICRYERRVGVAKRHKRVTIYEHQKENIEKSNR